MFLYAGTELKPSVTKLTHQIRDIDSKEQLHVQLLGRPTTVFTVSLS